MILRLLGPGDFAGGVAVMAGACYPATTEVVEASELLVWPEGELRRLTANYPTVAAAVPACRQRQDARPAVPAP